MRTPSGAPRARCPASPRVTQSAGQKSPRNQVPESLRRRLSSRATAGARHSTPPESLRSFLHETPRTHPAQQISVTGVHRGACVLDSEDEDKARDPRFAAGGCDPVKRRAAAGTPLRWRPRLPCRIATEIVAGEDRWTAAPSLASPERTRRLSLSVVLENVGRVQSVANSPPPFCSANNE